MEQAAAVLVGCGQRVGRVRGDGVVGGSLAVHRGQAASERTAALHLHPVRQLHLVLDRVLLVHPVRGGRRGRGARVRGHVLRRGGGEAVEVRAGVGRRGEGGHGGRAGAAAARVRGAGGVQARLEVADRPRVVVVRGGQRGLPRVQPGDPRAVDEVRPADLVPGEASWKSNKYFYLFESCL